MNRLGLLFIGSFEKWSSLGKVVRRFDTEITLDQALLLFIFFCFFGSRGKKITDYRDKGRGHDRRLIVRLPSEEPLK